MPANRLVGCLLGDAPDCPFWSKFTGTQDRCDQLTTSYAVRTTPATMSGCEIIKTCDESTSVICAPARCAMDMATSVPMVLSPQLGQSSS